LFFFVIFFISSCAQKKPQESIVIPRESTNNPQNIFYSGKKHLQNRNYTEAGKCFDQIVNSFPNTPEAMDAKFYGLLMDFMKGKEFPSDAKKILGEKAQRRFPQGFYADFEAFLLDLAKQLKEGKRLTKNGERLIKDLEITIELQKDEVKDLQGIISKLKQDNSKINGILEKIKIDYQKAETALEQQRKNYRKLQKIEMRKEKMEKELRELN